VSTNPIYDRDTTKRKIADYEARQAEWHDRRFQRRQEWWDTLSFIGQGALTGAAVMAALVGAVWVGLAFFDWVQSSRLLESKKPPVESVRYSAEPTVSYSSTPVGTGRAMVDSGRSVAPTIKFATWSTSDPSLAWCCDSTHHHEYSSDGMNCYGARK